MSDSTIIMGYDGSEASNTALDFAANMAQEFGSRLSLVHVIDWSPFEFQTLEENERQSQLSRDQIRADREKLFPPVLERLNQQGQDVDVVIEFGHPAEVIARIARDSEAAAIVVGRRGESTLKRVLFGGIANALVHEADCPVVIVP